ncbi:3-carboxy-cis,cis-muconate cycloisomerase [Brucellaceae bacterium C25G]
MSISVFNHPSLAQLFGADEEVNSLLTAQADITELLRFEASLATAQAELGLIPMQAEKAIVQAVEQFIPDIVSLSQATARDGVIIPSLIAELRKIIGPDHGHYLHFGATSQDIIDTSLMLRLKRINQIFIQRISELIKRFDQLEAAFGTNQLTAYTRMQAAITIRVSDRISNWKNPLMDYKQKLNATSFPVQLGGAAGTLEKFNDQQKSILRSSLANKLGLDNGSQWHTQRAILTEIGNQLSLITGTLGKFGQDIALLAETGLEISMSGGGTSSAMPHKQNPVAAETLVSLARFNAVQISGLHQAMVHEQERSGSGWMLEWMILPQIIAATGGALSIATNLIEKVTFLGKKNPD